MTMSMTGFGRAVLDGAWGKLTLEIQSINRRYLETSIYLPKELGQYENDLRKALGEKILRGAVTVKVQWIPSPSIAGSLLPSIEGLREVKSGWENICRELHLDLSQVDLRFLVEKMPASDRGAPFTDLDALLTCLEMAMERLLAMKAEEGRALVLDIQKRMGLIQKKLSQIEELSPEFSARMRQKLKEKIAPLFAGDASWDERLAREIMLFAEKVDITEEITRLKSHFSQFEECFHAKGSVGKKMDFVIQEMGREINTIGSKSSEAKISYFVVEIKAEMEKIREQVQNIE